MSLSSALNAGVSGLSAQANAMATVADNINNVSTVGYKKTAAQFSTFVTDSGVKGSYAAGGVNAVTQSLISKQGLLQASGGQTDFGIEGAGFFVVRSSADPASEVAFTRAGHFTPDAQGFLRNSAGYYLQGWPLDAQGNFANTGNLNTLEPIRPSAFTGSALPTTLVELRANLQSTTPAIAGPYVAGQIASGAVAPAFSRSVDINDAQGGTHRVTFGFVKTAANRWVGEAYVTPAGDVTTTPPTGNVLVSGTIAFNPDGSLDRTASTPALFAPLTNFTWTNGAGAAPLRLALGDDDQFNGLTQTSNESALLRSSVNGGVQNTIASVEVSDNGVVRAVYEDGTTRAIYQLPLATFQNPDGLAQLPGNAYRVSSESGDYAINRPGSLGTGTISSGTLESSTVDIAEEFTNMIRYQRAYSAASKIITTIDDMLQEVSNLKR